MTIDFPPSLYQEDAEQFLNCDSNATDGITEDINTCLGADKNFTVDFRESASDQSSSFQYQAGQSYYFVSKYI